jgi:hypothetical protein
MKQIFVSLGLALGFVLSGRTQVTVEVVMDQEHFLVGEAIRAAIKVTNRSGQTLHLGDEPDWLTFSIQSKNGYIVTKNGEVPVKGEFTLKSGQVATRRVDLAPYFVLDQIGRYQITTLVRIKEWDTTVGARPKFFDVINGAKIWSQNFGMPMASGATNRSPEVRKYTLEQANYLRTQLRLYLRLTDGDGSRVIKVLPLGPMVSISNPEPQIDRDNNLHVLYQHGARSYLYNVITPAGDVVVRQMHDITATRPKLQADEKGNLFVAGGARHFTSNDLPTAAEADSESDAPTVTP